MPSPHRQTSGDAPVSSFRKDSPARPPSLKQMSSKEQLKREVERLKQENARLKKTQIRV